METKCLTGNSISLGWRGGQRRLPGTRQRHEKFEAVTQTISQMINKNKEVHK